MKNLAVVLFCAGVAIAQNPASASRFRAACGNSSVQFEVKNEKKERPEKADKADKSDNGADADSSARLYVVENLRAGCFLCDTTTRIGLDGNWVGATKGNSYFSVSVEPGEHHLCADLQSVTSSPDSTGLAGFTAEAGKSYYFRAKLTDRNNSGKGGVQWALDLEPIDSDEGPFLVGSFEVSSARPKR
jgi:hypothetical protein